MTLADALSQYSDILSAILIFISSIIIAKLFYLVIIEYLLRIAKKTGTTLDEELLKTIEKPIYLGIILIGLYLAVISINILKDYSEQINNLFLAIGILWGVFMAVRSIDTIFKWHIEKAKKRIKIERTALLTVKNIIDVVIYIVAFLLILAEFGIEITPLIASLGIGGLAVALALQNTLSNYFAGIYIATDRSIKLGNYIELENGLKGYVESIGWRSTKIRTLPNNIVIVPNAKLAEMIVINYYDPEREMSVIIHCGVSYESDLEKVERVTIETAKKVLQNTKGGIGKFEPFIRYNKFGDSNIEFSIILRVKEFTDKYLVTHEFVKELMKRYRKEDIEISYPVRKVYMRET